MLDVNETMKMHTLLTVFTCMWLTGCGHYNYAVKKEGSPIPFENQYEGDDAQDYEFYSTLYKVNPKRKYSDLIEITHLSDVYNHHHGTPESTWRKSSLSFQLSKEAGIELIPESVVLEHYSESGKIYLPSKIESTLSKCSATIGCRESLVLHYESGMPKKLIEKVTFKIVVNGKEEVISYTIPLVYKFHYSFWDVMMGV
jgi:hypothetical protein